MSAVEVIAVTLEIDLSDEALTGEYGEIDMNWEDEDYDDAELRIDRRYGGEEYDLVMTRTQTARVPLSAAVATIIDNLGTNLPRWAEHNLCNANKTVEDVTGATVIIRVER